MAKNKHDITKEMLIRTQPTIYAFDFKDIPIEKYADTLDMLFHNPDFIEGVEKRNRLVKSVDRMCFGSSEMKHLVQVIQQNDRKLADAMYAAIVQTNIHSEEGVEYLSFSTLLRYYVDYSRADIKQRVEKLSSRLYKVTFLADMLESVVVDVKSDMQYIFGDDFQFQQFDGVQQVLVQLRGYFDSVRPKDIESADAQLYLDYSDSINDYLEKRLKTYTEKIKKIHPEHSYYTSADVLKAANCFFGMEIPSKMVKHTETGNPYLDVKSLRSHLSEIQNRKLDKLILSSKNRKKTNNDFIITSAILNQYKSKK